MASNGVLRSTTRPQWPPASLALAVLMLVCTGCHQPSAAPAAPAEPADLASAEDSPRIKQLFLQDAHFAEKIEEIAGRVRELDQPDRPTKDR